MGFCGYSDAEVIALTRQRRREAREAKAAQRVVVRFSVQGDEFTPSVSCSLATSRSKARAKTWRIAQWKAGNRTCFYCRCELTNIPRKVRQCVPMAANSVTVDHRHPVSLGGDDAAWNYAMACHSCNNAKGQLTEAEFRAVRGLEQAA